MSARAGAIALPHCPIRAASAACAWKGSHKDISLIVKSQMEMSFTDEERTMIVLGMSVALITSLTLVAQTLLLTIERKGRVTLQRVF